VIEDIVVDIVGVAVGIVVTPIDIEVVVVSTVSLMCALQLCLESDHDCIPYVPRKLFDYEFQRLREASERAAAERAAEK
jgi:hypothetical protein